MPASNLAPSTIVLTVPLYNTLSPTLIETFPLKSSATLITNEVFSSTVTFKPVTSAAKSAGLTVNETVSLILGAYLLSPA